MKEKKERSKKKYLIITWTLLVMVRVVMRTTLRRRTASARNKNTTKRVAETDGARNHARSLEDARSDLRAQTEPRVKPVGIVGGRAGEAELEGESGKIYSRHDVNTLRTEIIDEVFVRLFLNPVMAAHVIDCGGWTVSLVDWNDAALVVEADDASSVAHGVDEMALATVNH
jgi:hypothetical protein